MIIDDKLKNKIYTNILLLLFVFFISYFFIYPQYSGYGVLYSPSKNISSLLEQKRSYESAIILAEDYQSKLNKVNNSFADAPNNISIDNINKILPNSADPVLIIYELSRVAAKPESSMMLTSPTFSDNSTTNQNNNKKYNTLTISFAVEGTYENMKAFLKNLEKSERVYNVTNLSFSSSQDTKYFSPLKYSMTVETYYVKQN